MAQIAGTYQHEKNENLFEYLKSIGTPEDKAKKLETVKASLKIAVDGKKVTLTHDHSGQTTTSTFTLDEEVDDPLPNNVVLKSTAKLAGDTLTIVSKTPDGKTGSRVYKASDSGLVVTLTSEVDATVGKRYYKRA